MRYLWIIMLILPDLVCTVLVFIRFIKTLNANLDVAKTGIWPYCRQVVSDIVDPLIVLWFMLNLGALFVYSLMLYIYGN